MKTKRVEWVQTEDLQIMAKQVLIALSRLGFNPNVVRNVTTKELIVGNQDFFEEHVRDIFHEVIVKNNLEKEMYSTFNHEDFATVNFNRLFNVFLNTLAIEPRKEVY